MSMPRFLEDSNTCGARRLLSGLFDPSGSKTQDVSEPARHRRTAATPAAGKLQRPPEFHSGAARCVGTEPSFGFVRSLSLPSLRDYSRSYSYEQETAQIAAGAKLRQMVLGELRRRP